MTYTGTIRRGVVVLDGVATLNEGDRVVVRPLNDAASVNNAEPPTAPESTLYEQFKDFIGICDGLPPDMAENHDHYIHGTPKRGDGE